MKKNPHIGSSFDEFLAEDGQLDEATAVAVKRVIAWQIEQAMQAAGLNKSTLAKRMHTSRTVVDRILDSEDTGLTLDTMTRAATALGFRVKFDLVAA
ncbi:MAG TPA: XRE family transcriptional regulator [Arenimonas sp.]|nr:XRE family transcriptional regulator [Arenimonas sp.]MBP7981551.1 XRE family transcriptional regulator [Arenimonas sp.]HWR96763.1 XRE family transcriptional regulator [Arenimonas sp.]